LRGIGGDSIPFYTNLYRKGLNPLQSPLNPFRAILDTLVMRGVEVDCDVLQEFLTYWGFILSLIPPNHFNTRVPKLGLKPNKP
jgi:hypothetical protein